MSQRTYTPPRLYLITPPLAGAMAFVPALEAALGAGDVAAVLLRHATADERSLSGRTKAIAPVVQRRDVALLLDGHADLVARTGADGAHLNGIEELSAAIGALKPDRIAGCGGLRSRHDAMLAGEANADYVMFGEPNNRGSRPPFDAVIERVGWWAGLFEVPCVGYAASLDEVALLKDAGADFVALGDWIWINEHAPSIVNAASALLSETALAL